MGLTLVPKESTLELFLEMEKLGVIKRLISSPVIERKSEKNSVRVCYETPPLYGGHKLIHVTLFEEALTRLTSHPHHEDFLLLGPEKSRPMVLVISKHKHGVLTEMISKGTLTEADFFCFYVKLNDPNFSFFTMMAEYPHAEICKKGDYGSIPPSFFVTESAKLPENIISIDFMKV